MDPFQDQTPGLNSPLQYGQPITPDDGNDLPVVPRAIYVGQAGNITLQMADGTTLVMENLPAGSLLPVRALRVLATGTAAAGLIALW